MTDISLPKSVDAVLVERTIASGARSLRFPRKLEALFEEETGPQRCRQLLIRAYIGIIVYDLFAIADWWAAPGTFMTAVWMRLGFFTPLALAMSVALYRNPPTPVREGLMCFGGGILSTLTIFYLMMESKGAPHATLHESMILIVLFLSIVQRLRFWYLAPACLAFLLAHMAALAIFYHYSVGLQVATNMVFDAAVVFALIASYTLEHELRLNYLLSLRGRLQNLELDRISRRDPLTGLGNRRSLDERLADFEQNVTAIGEFAVILLDIDHFKMFNDTAGHQAGDACLQRIAAIIRAELRHQGDQAFRFGGEEFLVTLSATDLSTGISIAERMRRSIEDAAIPHPALPAGSVVTASFGIAAARNATDTGAAEIIAGADAALYAAKHNGRNQVWPPFLTALGGSDQATRKWQVGG